jgi:hypothetical protein
MKKVLLLIALALPLTSIGGWTDETGKPVPDTPSMRSSGEFGAQLLLTSSEQAFRQNWNTTAGTPKLHTTRTVKVGQSISGVILFTGCTPGGNHACVVSAAFSLASPDGSKSPAGNGQVWSKAPPKPRVIMLGDASITIGFGPDDAPGTYTLLANVTDQVAKRTLTLSLPFTVVPGNAGPAQPSPHSPTGRP